MKIFDSHCHLDDRSYDKDREDVIQCAQNARVVGIMIVGVDNGSGRGFLRHPVLTHQGLLSGRGDAGIERPGGAPIRTYSTHPHPCN